MAINTPDSATQVEDRIKADVQREAPDSNPYLRVHWLRSLIAGVARRLFDLYRDLDRVEKRLFPDTADDETAPVWGDIFVGPPNPASAASGQLVGTGTAGGIVSPGATLTAGGNAYAVTSGGTVTDTVLNITSLTRSGTTATAVTAAPHGLSSFNTPDIVGADQSEYNVTGAEINVTGEDTFEYQISDSPVTPATGTIAAEFTTVNVEVLSTDFGAATNLDLDTAATLQSPIVDVDDTFYVTFSAVGGGTDAEATSAYKERYLEKIRDPVAHFNAADIRAKAKTVPGVTRVFVEEAGAEIGTIGITSLTRQGNVAKAVTDGPHGFESLTRTTVNGADQSEYNVSNTPILVEDSVTFHYLIAGSPVTPATGTINAATVLPLGMVRTFFTRDNDSDPIPSPSEVQTVKDAVDEIRPANTSSDNNIVAAPVAVPVAYTFTALTPNTSTMRAALSANLAQFHEEEATVGRDIGQTQYEAVIQNTVDPNNGDRVTAFTLSTPSGTVSVDSGQLATLGVVSFP